MPLGGSLMYKSIPIILLASFFFLNCEDTPKYTVSDYAYRYFENGNSLEINPNLFVGNLKLQVKKIVALKPSDDESNEQVVFNGPFVMNFLTGELTPALDTSLLSGASYSQLKIFLAPEEETADKHLQHRILFIGGYYKTGESKKVPFRITMGTAKTIKADSKEGFALDGELSSKILNLFDFVSWLKAIPFEEGKVEFNEYTISFLNNKPLFTAFTKEIVQALDFDKRQKEAKETPPPKVTKDDEFQEPPEDDEIPKSDETATNKTETETENDNQSEEETTETKSKEDLLANDQIKVVRAVVGTPAGEEEDNAIYYQVPDNPVGLIYIFHGQNGNGYSFHAEYFQGEKDYSSEDMGKKEAAAFVLEAFKNGFGTVSMNSRDRVKDPSIMWDKDLTENNPDVLYIRRIQNYLTSNNIIDPKTVPQFGMGISNGGGFVPRAAFYLGFKAMAVFIAAGDLITKIEQFKIPTIFNYQTKDTVIDVDSLIDNYQILVDRGVTVEKNGREPDPLTYSDFKYYTTFSEDHFDKLHKALVAEGLADGAGNLTLPTPTGDDNFTTIKARKVALKKAVEGDSELSSFQNAILEQVLLNAADHRFNSDLAKKTMTFFKNNKESLK